MIAALPEGKMTIRELWAAVNRYVAIYICLAMFAALCVGAHMLAVMMIAACDGHFLVMNEQTTHNMALIAFMDSNRWFPGLYAILTFGGVFVMQMRKNPEWAWWLWCVMLCAPFTLYLLACGYIAIKLP
jgi:hypothetical protein